MKFENSYKGEGEESWHYHHTNISNDNQWQSFVNRLLYTDIDLKESNVGWLFLYIQETPILSGWFSDIKSHLNIDHFLSWVKEFSSIFYGKILHLPRVKRLPVCFFDRTYIITAGVPLFIKATTHEIFSTCDSYTTWALHNCDVTLCMLLNNVEHSQTTHPSFYPGIWFK